MKKLRATFFLVLWTVTTFAGETGLELIPRGRPFRLTFADPREIRMAIGFEGDSRINATIGNYFSVFALQPANDDGWLFHFGLEGAGFFTMRQADRRFPLDTADGLIGVYAEGKRGDWQAQFRYTHISAHLADGSTGSAIAYSRESAILRGAWVPSDDIQVYSGVHYLVNTVPKVFPWSFQMGGSFFLPLGKTKLVPFTGTDFKWKEESKFNPSFSFQVGIALNNPPEAYRSFRFFYGYYTGADVRGQFYDQNYTAHSLGVEMQI